MGKLREKNTISDKEYRELYATGTSPNILYGLPKIHKRNHPMRPIISSFNSPQYKLAKFIIKEITYLTENEYVLKNSQQMIDELKNINLTNSSCLVSFDIESLYTNIPVNESINIIADLLYANEGYRNLSKREFTRLLHTITDENYLIFDQKLLRQIEGLAMGNPISATFANIFMNFHEQIWLDECPLEFKPLLYRRYVDDTFALFKREADIAPFFNYINGKHRKIKFTMEKEKHNKLPFLDLLIEKTNGKLETSIYRKPTFSGLGINYLSACFRKYKINSIKTLLHRAYNLTSTYWNFHTEIEFLSQFFFNNGFNLQIFYKVLRQFLNSKYEQQPKEVGPLKKAIYVKFPYISDYINNQITHEIKKIILKYLPHSQLHLVFFNNFKIRSFFKYKDSLPRALKSLVIYHFTCPKCSLGYIGSTKKNLLLRVKEHQGISARTERHLVSPPMSSIRNHCQDICKVRFDINHFEILASCSSELELRVKESIFIHLKKPELNIEGSAFNLCIY